MLIRLLSVKFKIFRINFNDREGFRRVLRQFLDFIQTKNDNFNLLANVSRRKLQCYGIAFRRYYFSDHIIVL